MQTNDVEEVIEYLKSIGEHQRKRIVEMLLKALLEQSEKIIELEGKLEDVKFNSKRK